MADYVVAGLVKRRAELAGEAEAIKARLARIATDLGHPDATIRLFDPDHDIAGIRAKRPRGPGVAGRGEMARLVLGALRDAPEPMTTAGVAERVMAAARGMAAGDAKARRAAAKRVGTALGRQRENGAVRSSSSAGRVVLWEIVRWRALGAPGHRLAHRFVPRLVDNPGDAT